MKSFRFSDHVGVVESGPYAFLDFAEWACRDSLLSHGKIQFLLCKCSFFVKEEKCKRHACRNAGTISVLAAWTAGATPARAPAIAATIVPVVASRTDGVKAIATASAPTDRLLSSRVTIADPTPINPPAMLSKKLSAMMR